MDFTLNLASMENIQKIGGGNALVAVDKEVRLIELLYMFEEM
jgi:hypothetical protein